jgi:hypothetical protein
MHKKETAAAHNAPAASCLLETNSRRFMKKYNLPQIALRNEIIFKSVEW